MLNVILFTIPPGYASVLFGGLLLLLTSSATLPLVITACGTPKKKKKKVKRKKEKTRVENTQRISIHGSEIESDTDDTNDVPDSTATAAAATSRATRTVKHASEKPTATAVSNTNTSMRTFNGSTEYTSCGPQTRTTTERLGERSKKAKTPSSACTKKSPFATTCDHTQEDKTSVKKSPECVTQGSCDSVYV